MAKDEQDPGTVDLESYAGGGDHLTPVQRRLVDAAGDTDDPDDPAYLHTILCQTAMPYRRTAERRWQHRNGRALLWITAGEIEGADGEPIEVPLPWGPKARVVLAHLNGEALRQGSRYIDVENSLHAFARRVLGYAPNGKEMRAMREHLTALSAALVHMSYRLPEGGRYQTDDKIVRGMYLWGGDERQKTLWPSQVVLSADYWESLTQHAVPLNPSHIAALSHTAMGLDIYAWLAQRLHRVRQQGGQFIGWQALQDQFGHGFGRIDNFRRTFRREIRQVLSVYQDARVGEEIDGRGKPHGLRLERSRPPILPKNGG